MTNISNCTRQMFESVFEADLALLRNVACQRCDAKIKRPLLPWLVGQHFSSQTERVMFVGKPHRGTPGLVLPSGLIDPTDEVAESLWDISWPYWSYTREIAENLFGPDAQNYIAFSNLIKCTNVDVDGETDSTDTTSEQMARGCIGELRVIWKEAAILKPTSMVFYTHTLFREMLRSVPIALPGSVVEVTPEGHFIPCRNKKLGWWERTCETEWTENLRILVVGHPERMGKAEYVRLLTDWLKGRASA